MLDKELDEENTLEYLILAAQKNHRLNRKGAEAFVEDRRARTGHDLSPAEEMDWLKCSLMAIQIVLQTQAVLLQMDANERNKQLPPSIGTQSDEENSS